jgi:hypothetical protein
MVYLCDNKTCAKERQVYQKVLSIYGVIADPATLALEGNLTVSRLDDGFPPTFWPVSSSISSGYPRSIDKPL